MKKTLALIIAIAMVLGTMSGIAFADSTTVSVWDGTYSLGWLSAGNPEGTEGDEFYLNSAADLAGFAYYVNNYASTNNIFVGDTVYLNVDVDLNNCEWEPIGNMTTDKRHFYGSFDGQNHTISNLKISETSGQIYGGLFGRFKGASFSQTFSNLTLHNVNITAVKAADTSKAGAGALMGYGYDQIINNVHVTGNISISGVSCVGGIAGQSRANISNSSVEAEGVVSGDSRVGGLVGWFISASANGYNAEIKDCSVKGNGDGLTVESGNSNAGGLVGRVNDNNGTVAIDKVGVYDVNIEVSGETVSVGAYVAPNFSKVTNAIVSNVTTSVNGEETTPSDNENVSLAVAEVDGTYYADLVSALKALKADSVLNLLSDVTIADKWDSRYTGSKILVPVTINGNGHTIKFTNEINDGFNYLAAFRVEANATFENLTIDLSEAISVFNNRFSAISTNGCDLTVEKCTFIGSEVYTSARAIIFGEGGSEADEAVISVTGSQFKDFLYGVVDNMNGVDVAENVTITDSSFANAGIQVSASEEVVLTNNIVEDAYVNVTSYSPTNELTVRISGNILEEAANGKENSIVANEIIGQGGFATPVADVNGKKYLDLQTAINKAADGDTIKIIEDIALTAQDANPAMKVAYNRESYAGLIIPDDKAVTINLNGKTVSYVDEYFDCDNVMVLNLGDLTINDTVGGGKMTYKPVCGSNTYTYFYSTIFNCGKLTVNGGVIENTCETATDVTDAVDNHSRLSHEYGNNCILVVNGGTLIGADYRAVRQYTHYLEGVENRVTINGGVVKGGIYMQHGESWYYANPEAKRLNVDLQLEINGGTITTIIDSDGVPYGNIRANLNNPDNEAFKIEINGGKIEVPVQVTIQRGVHYANGVSGTTVPAESAGARNAEWLAENGGFIYGGTFTELGDADDIRTNLAGFLAAESELQRTGSGEYTVINPNNGSTDDEYLDALAADSISIEYKDITAADAEGEKTYEVYVKANDDDKINELASVDLTFDFKTEAVKGGAMNITVLPTADFTMSTAEGDRYMFNYNGVSAFEGTANAIAIATIKVEGYGKFSIATKDLSTAANDTNIVNATTIKDNLVDYYVADGATDNDATTGALVINTDTDTTDKLVGGVANIEIAVPTRTLKINIAFPNEVKKQVAAYQDMKVEITGNIEGVNKTVTYNLGEDEIAMVDGKYVVTESRLVLNNAYTVTVSGAGYRTARYTVTMTGNKELNFWNNVMDEKKAVEPGKASSEVIKNFLAGDIVKDNQINIYDLSAVVSYFATTNETDKKSDYAKYDLNRDGVIDSKDVAYVLVSWGE